MNDLILAIELAYWQQTAIKVLVAAVLVPTTALILGIVFLFKMMSWMQSRMGPQEAGPRGLFQLLADGLKFLQKEDIIPNKADRFVFKAAPVVVLASTFLTYVILPAGPDLIIENLPTGIFFAMAVSSLSVIGVLMAGWSSSNKYALMGALRAGGQLIAYELPLILAVMGVVIQAGSLSMQDIVLAQANGSIFGFSGMGLPFLLTQLVAFFIFMVAIQAELTQPPFDMPVAESEVVGGFHVEYTGFRFLFFFLGEFATAFAFAAIAATLFLGGWYVPGVDPDSMLANIVGPIALFAKIMIVAFLIFWFRFTYPRFREDQLQRFAWKYLIPLALVNITVTGILVVAL